jgi:hypothetical protein
MHRGYDVGSKSGTPVYSYLPGVVTRILINGRGDGGYGNAIEWKDDVYGQTHFYGHLLNPPSLGVGKKFSQKTLLGYVGGTGNGGQNTYADHLHWEIGPRGSEQDPGEWLRKVGLTPSGTKGLPAAPTSANPSTPAPSSYPAQISPTFAQQNQQQVAQQITPERRGQDVVAIIPQQQAAGSPQSAAPASSAGGGSSAPSMFDVLNTFMKQKLLLDLAYV